MKAKTYIEYYEVDKSGIIEWHSRVIDNLITVYISEAYSNAMLAISDSLMWLGNEDKKSMNIIIYIGRFSFDELPPEKYDMSLLLDKKHVQDRIKKATE